MNGHVVTAELGAESDGAMTLSQNYSHLVRDFFARRVNFLEVVAAALNADLADHNLVEQFFDRIIETNSSYAAAVDFSPAGWPELSVFYRRARPNASPTPGP